MFGWVERDGGLVGEWWEMQVVGCPVGVAAFVVPGSEVLDGGVVEV